MLQQALLSMWEDCAGCMPTKPVLPGAQFLCVLLLGGRRQRWTVTFVALNLRQSMVSGPIPVLSTPTLSLAHMPRNLAVLFLPCGSRAGTSPLLRLVSVCLRATQTEEAPRVGAGGLLYLSNLPSRLARGSTVFLPNRPLQGHLTSPLCHQTFSLSRKAEDKRALG